MLTVAALDLRELVSYERSPLRHSLDAYILVDFTADGLGQLVRAGRRADASLAPGHVRAVQGEANARVQNPKNISPQKRATRCWVILSVIRATLLSSLFHHVCLTGSSLETT